VLFTGALVSKLEKTQPMGMCSPTCIQPSRRANTCKTVPRGTLRNTVDLVGAWRTFAPWRVTTLSASIEGGGAGVIAMLFEDNSLACRRLDVSGYLAFAVLAKKGAGAWQ
jgi:hypothetical protein